MPALRPARTKRAPPVTAIPIAIYWSLAIWGLFSRRPVLLVLFFAGLPFGSLAVIPPGLTAGLTFIPTAMTALLIITKTFAHPRRLSVAISAGLDPRRLGILTAFWLVSVVVTIFMPRLFQGVMVIPLRGADLSSASPLAPSMQNVSQLAYLTISVAAVFAFTQILKTRNARQTVMHALVGTATLAVVTGFLDLASYSLPIGFLLEPFRTATYALLVDVEIFGGKRVVGLMPEASVFGSFCLTLMSLLYFMRRGILNDRVRDVFIPPLIVLLMILVWLSTSTAAYVGLAVFFGMAGIEWLTRFLERRYSGLRRRHLGLEFGILVLVIAAGMLIALFSPSMVDAISDRINDVVLTKASSSSYEERTMWSAVSLQALGETYGIGVGLGATRSSNSVIAALSNIGVLGSIFYFGFLIQCLLRRAGPDDPEGRALISGLRYAFVPTFVVSLLIGSTPDFGGFGAFRYGLLTAIGMGGLMYKTAYRPARRAAPIMAPA